MKRTALALLCLCILMALAGCKKGEEAPVPTEIPMASAALVTEQQAVVSIGTPVPAPTEAPTATPVPTDTPAPTPEPTPTPAPTPEGLLGGRYDGFSYDGAVLEAEKYAEAELAVTIRTVEDKETYSDYITYYVTDIYIQDVTRLRTEAASTKGFSAKYGETSVKKMSDRVNALFAVSGDFHTHNMGLVIRNGELYRKTKGKFDICVLYRDGTMRTFTPEEYDVDSIIAEDPWQVWTFGPGLLDQEGNPRTEFPNCQIKDRNPRCVLGYYEPGHYAVVMVDGRQSGYSLGLTMYDLAQLSYDLGFKAAYNLDGGKSAVLCWQGEVYNRPFDGGRPISDILYVTASETAGE